MKRVMAFLALAIFALSCGAAEIKSVKDEDIKKLLSESPKQADYPKSSAYMLVSTETTELFPDGTSIERVYQRNKIFNERGYNYGSLSLGYREGYSEVKVLFANTVKTDGTIVPLEQKDINDFAPYAKYDMYSDVKEKKFTMPALEPGCIIEFAYEIKEIKPILPGDEWDIFNMQTLIPIGTDTAELIVPKTIKVKSRQFNTATALQVEDLGDRIKYSVYNRNQPEIVPEPRMPELEDRETFSQLYEWTLDSWQTVSEWYNKLVRGQMITSPDMETLTKELVKDKKTDEEKMSALYYYVSQHIRYVAVSLGPHTHQPHSAADVFRKKYGDCKDKTTLLLTMLKLAGIEGIPVLVPSSDKIFDENMPTLKVFNHVIAAVLKADGSYYWMDGTNEVAAFNASPFGKAQQVLAINSDGSYKIVKTPELDRKSDYAETYTKCTVQENGDVTLEKDRYYYGWAAEGVRYGFKYTAPEERKKYFEKGGIVVSDLQFGDFDNNEKPFFIKLKGTLPSYFQKIGDNMLILSGDIMRETYNDVTTAKERKYPVSFEWSCLSKFKTDYVLPEGYKIKNLPKDYTVEKPYRKGYSSFSFSGSTFNWMTEATGFEYKLPVSFFEDFKKESLRIQKYNADVKSIIFEKSL